MVLPEEWTSPSKYSYKLRGWYDVTNAKYYPAGAEMEVTGNAVLYADWVAATYDVGQFNARVTDTVSTSSFITTYMFDYNYLFNVQSSKAQVSVNNNSHSETWSMVTTGNVAYKNQQTFDFIFTDNDAGGELNMPNNRSSRNMYHDATTVTSGIYSAGLGELLFSPYNSFNPETGEGIMGKTYLGTGDHLFQIMNNISDEHYGYYYYDSKRNAASYNQSAGRFYVYDYLSATSDSLGGAYSDFIPLNSPYANTNGKTVGTYTYAGVDGEYQGVNHYRFDSKYNSGDHNSANAVYTDYAYGMRMDIKFYLPNDPGTGGNKDLYGNDMEFEFSGDDDLWVLIDGKVVLDIGGIHQIVGGYIDFSTGQVYVNGRQQTSLMDLGITAGDHTLTVLYLERGASMSNCSIYFNLAPRFGLQLQKEDVLTQQLLNGTQFTVYEDLACTTPVELWESEEAYNQDLLDGVLDQSRSTFTVTDGVAKLWGLGSGNTYYIKETGPPLVEGYGLGDGLIRLKIEKEGQTTYNVDVIPDAEGNGPSNGFTVHGIRIEENTKTVYIIATNAPESVLETTTVQVLKKWEDNASHIGDYITAYLTVTDPDGTVRRIREITLSDENNWKYTWTNLPKYDYDALTEVVYGIEESYESGYYSTVRRVTQIEITTTEWAEATSLVNGDSYLLKTNNGYLSTTSSTDGKLRWVDEQTARNSPLATWTATVSGSNNVKFTNGAGQSLNFNNGNSNSNRYFNTTTGNSNTQTLTWRAENNGFKFSYTRSWSTYYMGTLNASNGRISNTTNVNSATVFKPMKKITQTDIEEVEDWAYQITNTPLDRGNETSLSVRKAWNLPAGYDETMYQEFAVTVRLLANGVNTGRSITLNLRNNWQGSFQGLPYQDAYGNVIRYSVVEIWDKERWSTTYGEIQEISGSPPTYSTVITNTYFMGGPELPSTGTHTRLMYMLCGYGIMLGSLVYGIGSRRKRERRMK
jgi:fibro-slime domain-containing protein